MADWTLVEDAEKATLTHPDGCCLLEVVKGDWLKAALRLCVDHHPDVEATMRSWQAGIDVCVEKYLVYPDREAWDDWLAEWNETTDAQRIEDGHRIEEDPPTDDVSRIWVWMDRDGLVHFGCALVDLDPQRRKTKSWETVYGYARSVGLEVV